MATSIEHRVETLERSARRARWIAAVAVGVTVAAVLVGQATSSSPASATTPGKDALDVFIDQKISEPSATDIATLEAIRLELVKMFAAGRKATREEYPNERPSAVPVVADGWALVIAPDGFAVVVDARGVAVPVQMLDSLAKPAMLRDYNLRYGEFRFDYDIDIDETAKRMLKQRKQHRVPAPNP